MLVFINKLTQEFPICKQSTSTFNQALIGGFKSNRWSIWDTAFVLSAVLSACSGGSAPGPVTDTTFPTLTVSTHIVILAEDFIEPVVIDVTATDTTDGTLTVTVTSSATLITVAVTTQIILLSEMA